MQNSLPLFTHKNILNVFEFDRDLTCQFMIEVFLNTCKLFAEFELIF